MTHITITPMAPTVQSIITETHRQIVKDIAAFIALSAFIGSVLVWAA